VAKEVFRTMDPNTVRHGHNSIRFRCGCGRLHRWRHAQVGMVEKRIPCPCGVLHVMPRRNWRGEGF